jgi:hypothetical protein
MPDPDADGLEGAVIESVRPMLLEIRGLIVAQDSELEALREELIGLKAAQARERKRTMEEAKRNRVRDHELRELRNEVQILKGGS